MPNPYDCSQRDFSKYDTMSTQQLQQFLREDVSKIEGEESDTAAVLYVMDLLARRRRETAPGKTPEEAFQSFKEHYDTQKFFVSEKNTVNRKNRTHKIWTRSLAAVLALVLLLFGGTVTAKAFGFDLWETVAKWTQETFHFGYAGIPDEDGIPNKSNNEAYAGLIDALAALNIDNLHIPTWLPNGYTEASVEVIENPVQRQVSAKYKSGSNTIRIIVNDYLGGDPERVEQGSASPEVYSVGGMEYYIFNNYGDLQAVWTAGSYECYISGTLSLSEMKAILNSIEKGS